MINSFLFKYLSWLFVTNWRLQRNMTTKWNEGLNRWRCGKQFFRFCLHIILAKKLYAVIYREGKDMLQGSVKVLSVFLLQVWEEIFPKNWFWLRITHKLIELSIRKIVSPFSFHKPHSQLSRTRFLEFLGIKLEILSFHPLQAAVYKGKIAFLAKLTQRGKKINIDQMWGGNEEEEIVYFQIQRFQTWDVEKKSNWIL